MHHDHRSRANGPMEIQGSSGNAIRKTRSRTRIAGVVVLYRPPDSVPRNVETYLPNVDVLYVFDNSPDASASVVQEIVRLDKVRYCTMGNNVGMSTALNFAARKALEEDFDYLLTMDQDGAATKDMVEKMLECMRDDETIGIVTPFHQDRNTPVTSSKEEVEPVLTAMTSGNLLNLSAYRRVGEYLEQLFIDYVDIEYCLRLHANGYSVVRSNRAILHHTRGHLTQERFFGRKTYTPHYSPSRLFYQTRNRFYLRRIYGSKFPEYFAYDRKMYWRGVVKMLLYENHRLRKLLMICRGFIALWRNDFTTIPMQ